MSDEARALRKTFVAHHAEALAELEETLLALERSPNDAEALNVAFRAMHTLKGDAGIVGLPLLRDLAHAAEDLLELLRGRQLALDAATATTLLEVRDALAVLVADAEAGAPAAAHAVPPLLAAIAQRKARARAEARGPEAQHATAARESAGAARGWLRVPLDSIDRLLELAGEILTASEGVSASLAGAGPRAVAARDSHDVLALLLAQLRGGVMQLRMVEIGPLLRQQARALRDAASEFGREARLELSGEEALLDANVVEQLRAPLGHLVRNAVCHGLEPASGRERAGKPACGRVAIDASREGATIVVRVSDDGAGLDYAKIRARARALRADAEALDEAALAELLFTPGFSTAGQVGMSAGRGVGLDAVRSQIEAAHGSVEIASEAGRGATFTIRLPLTLALVSGLAVRIGAERLVVPLDMVHECLQLDAAVAQRAAARRWVDLRGAAMPYLSLHGALALPARDEAPRRVVVVHHGSAFAALGVDDFDGECRVLIKPLEAALAGLRFVTGTTIGSDGRVGLVLDVPPLVRLAGVSENQTAGRATGTPRAVAWQ